jgi:hypothetical protein
MDVFVGRANKIFLTLLQDGSSDNVRSDAIYRAMFKFGDFCVDTDNLDDPIELIEDNKKIQMQLGLVPGIQPGIYDGRLTVFDTGAPMGIAWGDPVKVKVYTWETCNNI